VLVGLRTLAERHELSAMAPFLFGHSRQMVPRMKPEDVIATLSGEVTGAEVNGGRVLLMLKGNHKARLAAFFSTDSGFKYDIEVSMKYRESDAGPRIPENRALPLADATRGIAGKGPLVASIETSMGTFTCTLFEDKAPLAVANFVALARGLRAFRDVKTGKWVKRPFYDGLTFHRVIPRFMIQGGCPKGNGSGDPGYAFADEFDLSLRHDRPGRMSLANSGPNTNGSQFFITEVPTPWLDDHHTIFGACEPIDFVRDVARVAASDSRPSEPVVIRHVQFRREE
jgi:peptidyl-prolyl cis-trans isomerase A (cyclophilin A)